MINFVLPLSSSLHEALKLIDKNGKGFLIITNAKNIVCGITTDGDIRRAILRGANTSSPISKAMNKDFHFAYDADKAKTISSQLNLKFIPILDNRNNLKSIFINESISPKNHEIDTDIVAVIMAGGLGSRLKPLTDNLPKALVKIGSQPMLEIIINRLKIFGIKKFLISVNYKAEMIKSYFGEGKNLNVEIKYIHESKRLGTAGSLSLISNEAENIPHIITNCDLISDVDFHSLMKFHNHYSSDLTVCASAHEIQIPYGVLKFDENLCIKFVDEKPNFHNYINSGIYVCNPSVFKELNYNEYEDMPNFVNFLISKNYNVKMFPILNQWIDIGTIDQLKIAKKKFT